MITDWISVNDQRPEIGERVLVYGQHLVHKGYGRYSCQTYHDGFNTIADCEATHWMPLASPEFEETSDAFAAIVDGNPTDNKK